MKNKSILLSFFVVKMLIADQNITTEKCVLESSQPLGYIGDSTGKRLYTQEEFTYLCTKTTTQRGECNNWKSETETIDISNLEPTKVYFETEDFGGSIGQMLAITQGYDKINGLWSGWHGMCMYGKDDGNFDWLSDPYVIGSYALTAYGASGTSSTSSTASNAATNTAKEEASRRAKAYAICAARAGLDASKMMEEYADDGEPCDPVDEFCYGDNGEIDSEVFTLPESKLNELLNSNPDMEKYIKILKGEGSGTVTIRVVNPGTESYEGDMAAAKEAEKEVKEMMLKIRAALMAIQLRNCIVNAERGESSGGTSEDADPLSKQNLAMMAINAINPMIGMAVSIVMNVASSLKNINTCTDESKAKEKGARHIATLRARALGQCHHIEDVTSGGTFSKRTRRRFCCYDDKTTRILVEQAKAQLAKDWQHCTDISLKELQYLNFKACDPSELDSSVDGTKLSAYVKQNERFSAYQYTNKCIDTREYINYMMETFGGEDMLIDTSDIESTLEPLQ
jgi:hypothetical protein